MKFISRIVWLSDRVFSLSKFIHIEINLRRPMRCRSAWIFQFQIFRKIVKPKISLLEFKNLWYIKNLKGFYTSRWSDKTNYNWSITDGRKRWSSKNVYGKILIEFKCFLSNGLLFLKSKMRKNHKINYSSLMIVNFHINW